MRYLSIILHGYVGIKNGLNLDEISIDLTKCKNRLVLLRGANGSGKSTLLNAINPLPDSNDNFITGIPARKRLRLLDTNTMYDIDILHGVKSNRERDTTKAYVSKLINDEWVQLNPNGNVGSYKDAIYDELGLDPNFLSLSQLTSTDKGLATKKPAERKKFINSIISSLDVYNDINKALTKKSSVYKTLMNSLITRLQQLGNEDILSARLNSICVRLEALYKEKEEYVEYMIENRQGITNKDPDGLIQKRYEELIYKRKDLIEKEIHPLRLQLDSYKKILNVHDEDDIFSIKKDIEEEKSRLYFAVQLQESKIDSLLIDKENEAKALNVKIQRLNSLQSDSNYKDIVKYIKDYQEHVSYCESIFDSIGIKDAIKISKDEYIIGLNTLKEIKEIVEIFRGLFSYNILEQSFKLVIDNQYPDIDLIDREIDHIKDTIYQLEKEYQENELLIKISSKLSLRPSTCNIDHCEFIKDAIIADRSNPAHRLDLLSNELEKYNNELDILIESKDTTSQIIKCINYVNNIIRLIDRNSSILDKLPNGDMFSNLDLFMKRLMNHDTFNDIDNLYSYIDCANVFEEYKIYKEKLHELVTDYKIYEEKNVILDEITSDIDVLNNRLNSLCSMIENGSESLFKLKEQLVIYTNKEIQYNTFIDLVSNSIKIQSINEELIDSIKLLENDMIVIKKYIEMVNIYNTKINTTNNHISSIEEERDKIKHALVLLVEYNNELEQYKSKYDKIETIKYYSSPTKKGIQLIFMEVYMHQILELANNLLSSFFEGRFTLQKFELNENEFRIPVQRDGIMNDDITSMSDGEIAIMSMIISFALLFKSSSKYNVLKLDEIDAALDNTNRLYFANLLESQSECLGVEQIFLISHNNEINASNCDVIILKTDNTDYVEGNIIYKY